jgi:adenosyl cobinamide kinase/adenosyl cobinamide phosphate guanylyltransferase
VESHRPQHIFIATAEALDAEISERIAHHIETRGDTWQTVEFVAAGLPLRLKG